MVTTHQDWLDAQVGVLGSVLIEPKLAAKVLSETADDDYTGAFQAVYQAIRRVFQQGKPPDPVLINDALGGKYSKLLMEIMDVTPSAASVDYYLQACKSRGRLLRLRELGKQLAESADAEEQRTLLAEMNRVSTGKVGFRITSMEAAMTAFYERREKLRDYLSWPIRGLDGMLYAEPGDFIIIGGYPSDGKSAFALQAAWHMAEKKRVGFFSLETSDSKLFDRLMAHVAKIPMQRLKRNSLTDANWDAAARASMKVTDRPLEIVQAAGMTVADIQAVAMAQRYDVIFVDYLQLVSSRGKDRFSVVTDISIGLHTMAQSSGVTVVALAQLNRPQMMVRNEPGPDGKKRQVRYVPPPELSNLRESGQIEQDADLVLMLYRPEPEKQERMLLVRKNKEGQLGSILLDFNGGTQTFIRSGDQWRDPDAFEPLPNDTYVPESFLTEVHNETG